MVQSGQRLRVIRQLHPGTEKHSDLAEFGVMLAFMKSLNCLPLWSGNLWSNTNDDIAYLP